MCVSVCLANVVCTTDDIPCPYSQVDVGASLAASLASLSLLPRAPTSKGQNLPFLCLFNTSVCVRERARLMAVY